MTPLIPLVALSALVFALVVLLAVLHYRTPQLVDLSVGIYRFLLAAYPTPFREEYGEAMAQLFRDTARAAYRQHGLLGLAVVWSRTLADFTISVLRQHRDNLGAARPEAVLLPDLAQQWRRLGSDALSVAFLSTWYGLHFLRSYRWQILTALAFGLWLTSFVDAIYLLRGSEKAWQVGIGEGLVEIKHCYDWGQPISAQEWWHQASAQLNKNPTEVRELVDRLRRYPWPWEFNFVSNIPEARGIRGGPDGRPEVVQAYQFWRLRFHFGILPLLLLGWTIRVYLRGTTGDVAAPQSA